MFSNGSDFRPSLTFGGKSRRHPLVLIPVRGSTLVSFRHACKCLTRIEVTNSGKHSSLLRHGKSCCRKILYSKDPRSSVKNSSGAPLRSKNICQVFQKTILVQIFTFAILFIVCLEQTRLIFESIVGPYLNKWST